MNSGNMQQMSVLQHQQMRSQQGAVSGGMPGSHQGLGQNQMLGQGNNPMAQMNNMNQAMLHMQQQQQQSLMQQHNPHVSIYNVIYELAGAEKRGSCEHQNNTRRFMLEILFWT